MTRLYAYGYKSAAPGWPAAMLTLDELNTKQPWNKLHPELRRRHLAIFDAAADAGTILGIGGAWRSAALQEATFRSRYTPHSTAPGIYWQGQYWRLMPGKAPSTPPGLSYHESTTADGWCLAVDTIGDWAFLAAHCAEYGLRQFADVNGEPWHTQPVEIATSRRNYAGQFEPGRVPVWPLPNSNPIVVDPPDPDPQPSPLPGDPDMASSILCLEDANPPHAYYRCDGVTKAWIRDQDAKTQIDMRLAESASGTKPAVDGFVYSYIRHGDPGFIASYGPIVGPVPDGHDIYGRH